MNPTYGKANHTTHFISSWTFRSHLCHVLEGEVGVVDVLLHLGHERVGDVVLVECLDLFTTKIGRRKQQTEKGFR